MSGIETLRADSLDQFGVRVAEQLSSCVPTGCATPQPDATSSSGQLLSSLVARPRSRFGPRLSYGRHRGPARADSRRAAVAIVIYPHRRTGQLCLTLTRRPADLTHHGGQICLPGGRIEAGESAVDAALREYEEELGLPVDVIRCAGSLRPIYVFASDNLVDTLVFTARSPTEDWNPDPVEVDDVIEMPVATLLEMAQDAPRPRIHVEPTRDSEVGTVPGGFKIVPKKNRRGGKGDAMGEVFEYEFGYRALRFADCSGHECELWGATAMLLDEFASVIAGAMVGRN